MPDITVYNLHAGPLVIPGGHYTAAIPRRGSATFEVPDVDEFVTDARVQTLVTTGYIRLEYSGVGAAYYMGLVSYGGGSVSTTAVVFGIAATDVITATLNSSANPVHVTKVERTATNTVTITFSANPGAATVVSLMVFRP